MTVRYPEEQGGQYAGSLEGFQRHLSIWGYFLIGEEQMQRPGMQNLITKHKVSIKAQDHKSGNHHQPKHHGFGARIQNACRTCRKVRMLERIDIFE
jgi:hypothetical protein